MTQENYNKLLTSYPMITFLTYANKDYIGVLQFCDDQVTTFYDFGLLTNTEDKVKFLSLAEEWWWQSNRKIPINIFLKKDWECFSHTLKAFNTKEVVINFGHKITLKDMLHKRKKKLILVKKI